MREVRIKSALRNAFRHLRSKARMKRKRQKEVENSRSFILFSEVSFDAPLQKRSSQREESRSRHLPRLPDDVLVTSEENNTCALYCRTFSRTVFVPLSPFLSVSPLRQI